MGNKKKTRKEEAAAVCAACRVACPKKHEPCVCTRVIFCSGACRQRALADGSHACTGAPSRRVNLAEQAREALRAEGSTGHFDNEAGHKEMALVSRQLSRPGGPLRPEVDEYVRCAENADLPDEQRSACAYHAGLAFKRRMLGRAQIAPGAAGRALMSQRHATTSNLVAGLGAVTFDSSGSEQVGVLEANELSFKYLSQAAQGGLGVAMQSLADNYEKGCGVRASMRMCREWYWRACLAQSVGAAAILDSKSVLVNEMMATLDMLGDMERRLAPGQGCISGGPNLCSLVLALHPDLAEKRFKLPPFAATAPSQHVGAAPRRGTCAAPLIGRSLIQAFAQQCDGLARRGSPVECAYGRRGIAAQATALSLGAASRSLDAQLFTLPPPPALRELYDDDEVRAWEGAAAFADFRVVCVHQNAQEHRNDGGASCRQCLKAGRARMAAVATGSVAISLSEELQGRGHLVIFRGSDGEATSETFKDYGRGEVEVALAALALSHVGVLLAHPLFVCQDPNLFWPLILSHGTIRAALEYVAPHLDWAHLGPLLPPLPADPLIAGAASGDVLRRCGSDVCLRLEADEGKGDFSKCARCRRRRYCSLGCQRADWNLHKSECKQVADASPTEPAAAAGEEVGAGGGAQTQAGSGGGEELAEDEEVILHGLVAKRELNGRVAVIAGRLKEGGRYPTKLGPDDDMLLAVKPANMHRLCVQVDRVKEGGSGGSGGAGAGGGSSGDDSAGRRADVRRVVCSPHGKECCDSCCLDLEIVNHLLVAFRRGKAGSGAQPQQQRLSRDEVERVAWGHFAKRPATETCGGELAGAGTGLRASPDAIDALPEGDRRAVMRAALQVEKPSLSVSACIAGMACWGAREHVIAQPEAIKYLQKLLCLCGAAQ
jgi:hypothetical protein